MLIHVQIDTRDPASIDEGIDLLQGLRTSYSGPSSEEAIERAIDAAASAVVKVNLHEDSPRLAYLHALSTAGDGGVDVQEMIDHWFNSSRTSYGGTRSAIQRSWVAGGGQRLARELIQDVPGGRQVMWEPARQMIERRSWEQMGEQLRQLAEELSRPDQP